MVVNDAGIKKLSKVKNIILNDSDLYPADRVVLRGIKTFNGQRIDEAILSSAAIVCSLGAPISHVFNKIIMGQKTILTKASGIEYKDSKGVCGWVNGQRVLVGNRDLLKEYKIEPPSQDYEKKYKVANRELTYLAIGYDLVAMFIIEYIPALKLADALYDCVKNNIRIYIRTVDSNISLQKISNDFNISEKDIVLLPYSQSQSIVNLKHGSTSTANEKAFAWTFGTVLSLMKATCACISAQHNITLATVLQTLGLAINVALAADLVLCCRVSELHNLELILYNVAWLLLTVIASHIKK